MPPSAGQLKLGRGVHVKQEVGTVATGSIELFSAARLVGLVPGSTRKLWLTSWIPKLVAAKRLVKCGKAWVGRRTEIEAAIAVGFAK